MTKPFRSSLPSVRVLAALAAVSLSACTNIGYRCPLDQSKSPDSPTACAGMHEALVGATRGTGNKTSALLDDQGRLIPLGSRADKSPSLPTDRADAAELYRAPNGEPLYTPGHKFQVWTRAFVDADGNLHEGHWAWFATPDRWGYGSLRNEAEGPDDNLMRPALPGTRPSGVRVLTPAGRPQSAGQTQPPASGSPAGDKAALQNLSKMVGSLGAPQGAARPAAVSAPATQNGGITAPSVSLGAQ